MANKNPGAERSGRAHVASFNFRNYADLGEVVKRGTARPLLGLPQIGVLDPNQMPMAAHTAGSAPALLLLLAPCQNGTMARIDRYDIIGIVLVIFVVALWVLHFSLPPQPPLVVVP